jgi:hypothetical protein
MHQQYLGALFDDASQRAEEFAAVSARFLAAEEALKRDSALDDFRAELFGKYALQANTRIEQTQDLELRLQVLEQVLQAGAQPIKHSRDLQQLFVAAESAWQRLSSDERISQVNTCVSLSNTCIRVSNTCIRVSGNGLVRHS